VGEAALAQTFVIRAGGAKDLTAVNRIIEAAIGTWKLPERVKRLAQPLYRYTDVDLTHLDLRLLEGSGGLMGVAAWESADARDVPGAGPATLLHGLYVSPDAHRAGLGTRLLEDGIRSARATGSRGILVRAQADAEGFFERLGFSRLPVRDESRDYAARFWLSLS
jgi:predicted N-acetyltransferase YhbS